MALTMALRLPYAHYAVLNPDETIYAVIAREILHGAVPYRDIWEIKPPLIFYIYSLILWLFGEKNLQAVRVVAMLAVAATALITAGIARREWGWVAGLLAGLGVAAYTSLASITQVQSADTELFLLLPQMLGVSLFLRLRPAKAYRDLFFVGLLTCAAAMIKQPAAGVVLLIGCWVTISPPEGRRRLASAGAFAAGALVLPIFFLIYFLLNGAIKDAFNLMVLNNFLYVGERGGSMGWKIFKASLRWLAIPNIVLWLLAFGSAAAVILKFIKDKSNRSTGRNDLFLAIFLLVCTLYTFAGVSFGGHYYMMMIPGLALMWARGASAIWLQYRHKAIRLALAAALLTGVVYPYYHFYFQVRSDFDSYVNRNKAYSIIGRQIDSITRPGDRIFVWGLNPEIYYWSQRRPASRFIYTTYQVGMVEESPSFFGWENESNYVMPETWDLLMQDLDKSVPALFIDTSLTNYFYFARYPNEKYPRLKRWLDLYYKLEYRIGGIRIYVRQK